jgi:hypothetical protein
MVVGAKRNYTGGMSNVLDYRTPANELKLRRIATALKAREGMFWIKVVGMLGVGAPASFVGPLVVTSIARKLCDALEYPVSGLTLLNLSCLTVLPLLYWVEARTRGNFLAEELQAQGTTGEDVYRTSSYGEWELRRTAVVYAVYIEVFLYGPRMVIGGLRRLRARARLRGPAIHRAAEIVMFLAVVDGGVSVESLRRSESPRELRQTLLYLQLHEWVDRGDRGRRVWLLSTARRRLKI